MPSTGTRFGKDAYGSTDMWCMIAIKFWLGTAFRIMIHERMRTASIFIVLTAALLAANPAEDTFKRVARIPRHVRNGLGSSIKVTWDSTQPGSPPTEVVLLGKQR
jgi:hypothetical protein